jgi:hypothetical protein
MPPARIVTEGSTMEGIISTTVSAFVLATVVWLWGKYVIPSNLYKKLNEPIGGKKKTPDANKPDPKKMD